MLRRFTAGNNNRQPDAAHADAVNGDVALVFGGLYVRESRLIFSFHGESLIFYLVRADVPDHEDGSRSPLNDFMHASAGPA